MAQKPDSQMGERLKDAQQQIEFKQNEMDAQKYQYEKKLAE